MYLTFLGTGDAFGSGGRFNTCFLLDTGDERALIDCGASSMIALKRAGIDPNDIGTILVTHLHADHFGGLPFFILDAQFNAKRRRPLVLAGPLGFAARLRQAMEVMFPGSSRTTQKFDLSVMELDDGKDVTIGGLSVRPAEVHHDGDAPYLAYRVTAKGRTIAYSGDTPWTDRLIEVSRDADLFICEAYFRSKAVPSHLDLATLERHLPDITARRLVLTHMSADLLGQLDTVDCETAYDGLTIVL